MMATEVKAIFELEQHSTELIDQVRLNHPVRIALAMDGEIVAGLVSPQDLKALEQLDQRKANGWARLREIRDMYFGDVSDEELMSEALKAQKEGRANADAAALSSTDAH